MQNGLFSHSVYPLSLGVFTSWCPQNHFIHGNMGTDMVWRAWLGSHWEHRHLACAAVEQARCLFSQWLITSAATARLG
jgi:hypothetical protein